MSAMHCEQATDLLDDWMAGRLDPGTAQVVEAHLEACPSCRLDADAARALAPVLPSLPRSVPPSRELWADIERRITQPSPRRVPGALIAATVALAGAVGLWALRAEGPAPPAEPVTGATVSAEVAVLELEAARLGDANLPPPVREALGRDLRIIDDAIREARAQLLATPSDPVAQALAGSAVRKKLQLLRRMGDYTT